jgi:hypothetical protein
MTMTRCKLIVMGALVLVSACGPVAPAEEPANHTSEAPDSADESKPASRKAELIGEWVMAPPPGQARQVQLSRYALASPPNDEAFAAMDPSEQERNWYRDVKRLRNEEPGSPLLEQLKRKLDELEAVRLTFTEDKLITSTQSGTSVTAYRIEEDLGDRVVILEDGDAPENKRRAIIAFVNRDSIVIDKAGLRIPMNRVPAGSAPPPSEAPRTSTSVPTPSSGGGSNDEYERCVAEYYRCVDAMDAESRAAMADLLAQTRRIFEEARHSPERRRATLASCKQSVELAHATYCPPSK